MDENQEQQNKWALLREDCFLVAILIVMIGNIFLLFKSSKTESDRVIYGNIILALLLLFSHIATYYINSGRWGRIINVIVWILLAISTIYNYFTR
jgi:hypothetical protein